MGYHDGNEVKFVQSAEELGSPSNGAGRDDDRGGAYDEPQHRLQDLLTRRKERRMHKVGTCTTAMLVAFAVFGAIDTTEPRADADSENIPGRCVVDVHGDEMTDSVQTLIECYDARAGVRSSQHIGTLCGGAVQMVATSHPPNKEAWTDVPALTYRVGEGEAVTINTAPNGRNGTTIVSPRKAEELRAAVTEAFNEKQRFRWRVNGEPVAEIAINEENAEAWTEFMRRCRETALPQYTREDTRTTQAFHSIGLNEPCNGIQRVQEWFELPMGCAWQTDNRNEALDAYRMAMTVYNQTGFVAMPRGSVHVRRQQGAFADRYQVQAVMNWKEGGSTTTYLAGEVLNEDLDDEIDAAINTIPN